MSTSTISNNSTATLEGTEPGCESCARAADITMPTDPIADLDIPTSQDRFKLCLRCVLTDQLGCVTALPGREAEVETTLMILATELAGAER